MTAGNPVVSLSTGTIVFDEDAADSLTIAVVSVPSSIDIREMFEYFRSSIDDVKAARVLKTEFARYYAVVLLMKSVESARRFIEQYDDRLFNLAEDNMIVIKKVKHIQMLSSRDDHSEISEGGGDRQVEVAYNGEMIFCINNDSEHAQPDQADCHFQSA